MQEFKAGDKVKCIHQDLNNILVVGKEYTITHIESAIGNVRVDGFRFLFWASRFELVAAPAPEWQPAVGDVVELLETKRATWTKSSMTHGNIGKQGTIRFIRDFAGYEPEDIKVIDCAGISQVWPIDAIKLITPAPIAALDLGTIPDRSAPSSPAEILTEHDYGTTRTDRRMRAEREAKREAQRAFESDRVQDAESLRRIETATEGSAMLAYELYRALTAEGNA